MSWPVCFNIRNGAIFTKSLIAQCSPAKTGYAVTDHFVEVNKMVDIGSGTNRKVKEYMLTRYACYLIVQNGDPRKKSSRRGRPISPF
jgi:DNA-damage-inducible protein D